MRWGVFTWFQSATPPPIMHNGPWKQWRNQLSKVKFTVEVESRIMCVKTQSQIVLDPASHTSCKVLNGAFHTKTKYKHVKKKEREKKPTWIWETVLYSYCLSYIFATFYATFLVTMTLLYIAHCVFIHCEGFIAIWIVAIEILARNCFHPAKVNTLSEGKSIKKHLSPFL